jgi:alanyl-tRNA synthetase
VFNGDTAFKLHDTYGFPLDLTADVCRERGVTSTSRLQRRHGRQRSRRAPPASSRWRRLDYDGPATAFHGYEHLEETKGNVLALYKDGAPVNELAGRNGCRRARRHAVLRRIGGQVGDRGELRNGARHLRRRGHAEDPGRVFGHHGVVEGSLKVGDTASRRRSTPGARPRTVRNHSATHLMHKALREVLGEHVQQKGSLVDAERTRFDFAHNAPVTDAQIRRSRRIVNAEILPTRRPRRA